MTQKRMAGVFLAIAAAIALLCGTRTVSAAEEKTYAKFDSGNNTLTFFTSTNVYTNGQTEGAVTYFADFADKEQEGASIPWKDVRENVETVSFENVIRPVSTREWFYAFKNLNAINNIQNLDTSNVTTMRSMFFGCDKLTALDVSHFNTSSVTTMRTMFYNCKQVTALNVSGFDTSGVTNMRDMFGNCFALTSLDVSSFDTSKVTEMREMFSWCKGLTSLDVSGFNTSSAEDMSYMFNAVQNIRELDLSSFVTDNVTNMAFMFAQCDSLEKVNLSSFNVSGVENMQGMFTKSNHLSTIYVNPLIWNTASVTNSKDMFYSTLVPGYDSADVDAGKATVKELGGYLTSIYPLPISVNNTVVTGISDQTYTGEEIIQLPEIKWNDLTLKKDTDYTLSYKDNIKAGTAAVIIKGERIFQGTREVAFSILPVALSEEAVSGVTNSIYSGEAATQNLTVKIGSTVLTEGTDYTISYENNDAVGIAAVIVAGTGNYAGTVRKTFLIMTDADQTEADSAASAIAGLKPADELTLADKAAVETARAAYDRLTDVQKALVSADILKKLTDAEAKIAEKEEAEAVKKGQTYTVSNMNYKVTNADKNGKGTVTLTGTVTKKTKLKKLTVPATVKIKGAKFKVTGIAAKAFEKYTKLAEVTIGSNVTTIGTSAFAGNTALKKVTIGKSTLKIGKSAFSGDKKLADIIIKSAKLQSVGKNAIKDISKKASIKVPRKQLAAYKKLFSSKTGFKKTMTIKK